MEIFRLTMMMAVIVSLIFARPAYAESLVLTLTTDRLVYDVGTSVTISGSLSNGSAVSDAVVLLEVDTPKHDPWIIRTFTTGQTPTGPWPVELLNVTPCSDGYGTPKYSFNPGQSAGFSVTLINNGLTPASVVVTINLIFSSGLPFKLITLINGTVQPGVPYTSVTWPVNIPTNSVTGQAVVYASIFDDYPKNNGFAFSPGKSAAFNITSGIPAQSLPNSPLGTFNLTASLLSTPDLPVWLGNFTAYATTHYGSSEASAQTNFTVQLRVDLNHDGVVNMRDIAIVARAFNTQLGDPIWNPIADLTGPIPFVPDGKIDMRDIALVAKAFGIVTIPDP